MSVQMADRHYSKSFFGFILKWQISERESYEQIDLYSRCILGFIPIWYLGVGYRYGQANTVEVGLHYYTKGLKVLDIFGIAEKWNNESGELAATIQ